GRIAVVTAAAGVIGLTAACGSSSDDASAAVTAPTASTEIGQSSPQSSAVITIDDYSYGEPITVAPGEQITVRNDDKVKHTVTSDEDDLFDAKVDRNATTTFSAPTQPGTYDYHCTYHSNMHGTLIVQEQ